MAVVCPPLASRLASCIGGLHFQIAERALGLWGSERFCLLTMSHPPHRALLLTALFPALSATDSHWHENIRSAAARVLALFEAADGAAVAALRAGADGAGAVKGLEASVVRLSLEGEVGSGEGEGGSRGGSGGGGSGTGGASLLLAGGGGGGQR